MSTHANRVKMTVTSVASSGTGDITLNAASSGFRSFATAYGANATVDILITEGTAWEIARNCTYTHSGTTLNRGTLENSSTGSAVAFTSAAVVSVIAAAEFGNNAEAAIQAVTPGGRLTLESGVPVSTTAQTAKTNIYYTPYVHNIINLWDGSQWKPITFSETTEALGTLADVKPHDIFGFLSGGALDLEKLIWTNGTTRATTITLQDGRYCKSGDKTRLYLGTFYPTSTTTTEDSLVGASSQLGGRRYLWNMYNRVMRGLYMFDTGADWIYKTATYRIANGATAPTCCVQMVLGLPTHVLADYRQTAALLVTTSRAQVGVGVNSSTPVGIRQGGYSDVSGSYAISALGGQYSGELAEGYNYIAALESGATGTDCQFSGGAVGQTGLFVQLEM